MTTEMAMTGRLDRAGAALVNAFRVLPVAGDPGYPSPGELAAELAIVFRARLGPIERLYLASAAMMTLDQNARHTLMTAAQCDREPPLPFTVSGRRHRPPPLTKIEQRRAAAITFDDSPRAILAAAWAGASDRDRRDLVNRAIGRVRA